MFLIGSKCQNEILYLKFDDAKLMQRGQNYLQRKLSLIYHFTARKRDMLQLANLCANFTS